MQHAIMVDPSGSLWWVNVPKTRRERARGLLGSPPPGPSWAMLFDRCRSVHTFGVGSPLEIVFLDARRRVISTTIAKPRRLLFRLGARSVLECSPGSGLRPGDLLVALYFPGCPRGRAQLGCAPIV